MRLSSLHILVVIFFSGTLNLSGQNSLASDETMTYEQYIEFVREYHPLVKRADLNLEVGESEVLKARGGFDPKLEMLTPVATEIAVPKTNPIIALPRFASICFLELCAIS